MASTSSPDIAPAHFVTTHWSLVLAAKNKSSPDCAAALETLCRTYWYPLYAFVRRQGRSAHDAQDLTQEFFARVLEHDYLLAVDREKGRFRTFLLVAFKRFLANEWDRGRTLKRGGQVPQVPFDTELAEQRYSSEQSSSLGPEGLYDRRWALTLLDQALTSLEAEYADAGKSAEFARLKSCLTADRGTIAYGAIAKDLEMTETHARVAVHRLRKRFREGFRQAVAETVDSRADIDDELRYLVGILAWS